MAGFSDATLELIRSRIELSDLIASYGISVRRNGSSAVACCPFHHEKTPSFSIADAKGVYHCFGCGASGDAFRFVQQYEGLTFPEAVEKLAKNCGVELKSEVDPEARMRSRLFALHSEIALFFGRCLKRIREAAPAREYLERRKLDDATVEKFGLGYAPRDPRALVQWARKYKYTAAEMEAAGILLPGRGGGLPYNRFGGRLIFPVRDKAGRVVAFSARSLEAGKVKAKYVNSPETAIFKKSNVLFAFDLAAGSIVKAPRREAIVCEGQIDVIRCHACGFTTAVASQGTAFTETHVKMLGRCADSAALVFDADGAGRKAALKAGALFLAEEKPVRVVTLPAGEDPDSFLRDRGAEEFRARLDAAESLMAFLVRTYAEAEADPGSVGAVSRIGRAAMEMVANCSSAVMRAAMLNEAAALLKLPVSALEDDFRAAMEQRAAAPHRRDRGGVTAPADDDGGDSGADASAAADATPRGGGQDAAAPQNNPPSPLEMTLCEFLFEHERDAALAETVEQYLPGAVLRHEFTRGFVKAWKDSCAGGEDALAAFGGALPPAEAKWLNRIITGNNAMGFSELEPLEILRGLVKKVWVDEVHRRRGMLPAAGDEQTERRRIELSLTARILQRRDWRAVSAEIGKLLAGE